MKTIEVIKMPKGYYVKMKYGSHIEMKYVKTMKEVKELEKNWGK